MNEDTARTKTDGSMSSALRDQLRDLTASSALVWLHVRDADEPLLGFPIAVGTDFFVISRLFQYCWENGYLALRLDFVEEAEEVSKAEDGVLDADFARRARRARTSSREHALPFAAATFAELIGTVCDHFPIVVMLGETESGKRFDFAAHVSSSDGASFSARLFETDGHWQAEDQIVPVAEIGGMFFGSEYERTLLLMSELDDALPVGAHLPFARER